VIYWATEEEKLTVKMHMDIREYIWKLTFEQLKEVHATIKKMIDGNKNHEYTRITEKENNGQQ
jgi:hypothetical protein